MRRLLVKLLALLALTSGAISCRTTTPTTRIEPVSLAGFYDNIEHLRGSQLQAALCIITRRGTPLTYAQARDVLFAYQPIECIYTHRLGRNVHDRPSAEAEGFNAEHLWPQSLGTGKAPARSDLHHLRVVDERENSRRSSLPFGELRGTARAFKPDISGVGSNVLNTRVYEPPDKAKGQIARALFYMYVRYGKTLNLTNFNKEKRTLFQWHHLYPVTSEEVVYHEYIYQNQGNRNPFVDRPEFVDRLELF